MYSRSSKDRMEELELQKQTIIEEIESIQRTKEKIAYGEDEIQAQLASSREDLDDEDLAVRKNTAEIIISRIEANREKELKVYINTLQAYGLGGAGARHTCFTTSQKPQICFQKLYKNDFIAPSFWRCH